jgi:phage-related tail fiber protein
MKIRIEMDFPRWLNRLILIGIPVAVVAVAAWVYAQVPNTFTSGQVLTAKELDDNFGTLQTEINALSATITTLQGTSTGNAVPPGSVVAFVGSNAPSGWLLCDGSAVSRTTYASLFAAIAITHGGGDGVATFNLPDYRGRFLRGVDGTAGRDPDSANRTAPQAGVTTVRVALGTQGTSWAAFREVTS